MSWYNRTGGQRRLMTERDLLAREYPGFVLDIGDDGTVFALGHLGPTPELRACYEVLVTLPANYGTGALPRAEVLTPTIHPRAPHRFTDGSLCVEHGDAFTPRSTLLTFLPWVVAWLLLYEGWQETGTGW